MTVRLVVLGGSGDAYLVCALLDAFKAHHGRPDVEVILRERLAPVADLFPGVRAVVNNALVDRAEADPAFQATYLNDLFSPEAEPFYAHPCFLRSQTRVDHLTTRWHTSQADMYRMMLRVPPDAPLTKPRIPGDGLRPGVATMIVDSTSWPNTQAPFWPKLHTALTEAGWRVEVNMPTWSLGELLRRCATSEWVLGPQCGVLSILVTGEFPCRKTLATPSLDGNRRPEFLARETYPYGYVTKFAGEDHDVEEHKVDDRDHDAVVAAIVDGPNARRLWPHDPRAVLTVQAPLAPGDFYDRLAVLTVKREHLAGPARAPLEREHARLAEIARQLVQRVPEEVPALYDRLVDLHHATYALLEALVPAALAGADRVEDHREAVALNRRRVALRAEIDALCHAPYGEVKTYYEDADVG